MEDRETARMRKYGESKTARIMMATVPNVTSGSGLRKFQGDGFLFDIMYCSAYNWQVVQVQGVYCTQVDEHCLVNSIVSLYLHKMLC